jgi:hypothetical protein
MRCRRAYSWMLATEAPEQTPPPAVERHLRVCFKCRRRYRRVLRLLAEVRQLTPPVEDPAVKQRFLAQFGAPLPRPAARPISPRPERIWPRLACAAAAAVLLIGLLSWGLLHKPVPLPPQPERAAASVVPAAAPPKLLASVLQCDLRLAQVTAPLERFQTLADLAGNLGAEALRLAQGTAQGEVDRLASLYDRVLRDGVVARAATVPATQRQVFATVAGDLRNRGTEAEKLADARPAAAPALRRMAVSSRTAAKDLLAGPRRTVPENPKPKQSGILLDDLVAHGLCLATEDDPLRRADTCTDVADSLARAIIEASASGDHDHLSSLGSYLGKFAQDGVEENLERAEAKHPSPVRQAQIERIRERTAQAIAPLEERLERAPAPNREGLSKALEAFRKARPVAPSRKSKNSTSSGLVDPPSLQPRD